IRREYSVARTPQHNGVAERRNMKLIEAARTMLADSKLPTTFWAEAVSTACYVQNRVLVIKPHNKTPFELFRVAAGTNSNKSAGTQGNLNVGTFTATSQDCIVMPIWKDASYFDSPSKKVGNDDPKSVVDNPKKDEEGPNNENNDKDKSKDDSSPNEDNTANQQVNTASLELNTSSLELITVDSLVNIEEPKRISKALSDPSWVEAMLEELLQNKKDERGIVIRNKSRLVAQGHTQEEGIDYDEVFAPVARIEAIRMFLAYASFMGFMVYQMDVKSAFLYGQIEEEVYVCQPLGFEDPDYPDKVYKVVKALYGLHQAPRAWVTSTTKKDGIFISQDKYVDEILRKFNFTYVKSASTPVDLEKPLVKDGDATDVDENLYRSMIGSLMYLTASRLNIMFAVCACARFQVNPKTSHLLYLKGKPTLGLWYSRDSPFELVAYTDSDYAGATQDRKSTTRGCQFLGNRMISWQCKKQNVVATSTTEAEYVAAASCCRQVGDEVVHKELGDRMERAAITASSLEAEQDSDAQTRFEAASKSPMTHLSQELTHLEVGRTL
ncbi:retrovirus-related pol polyprotein from transposon TNT 1-94, partial [Tanacetum coccineum]